MAVQGDDYVFGTKFLSGGVVDLDVLSLFQMVAEVYKCISQFQSN